MNTEEKLNLKVKKRPPVQVIRIARQVSDNCYVGELTQFDGGIRVGRCSEVELVVDRAQANNNFSSLVGKYWLVKVTNSDWLGRLHVVIIGQSDPQGVFGN